MKIKPQKTEAPKTSPTSAAPKAEFLFSQVNYTFLLIGIGVIILGFLLMAGGGSDNPKVFSEAIFNFRRIRLAPTIVLLGFGITVYAILKNSKNN
jgi:hypothetical protein